MNKRWMTIMACLVLLGVGVVLGWRLKVMGDNATWTGGDSIKSLSKVPASLTQYVNPVYEVQVTRDITYATKKNETEAQESLKLDLYEPVNAAEPRKPVFLFLHGGGYREGSKEDAASFSTALAQRGYAVISMNYRLKADPEANMRRTLYDVYEDMSDAMGWIRKNAEQYGLDSGTIAIGGDSAGGHLAMNYVNETIMRTPFVVDPIFAIVDIYGGRLNVAVQDGLPPILIVHGTNDKLIPYEQSVQLARVLDSKGVPYNFYTMEGEGHDYRNNRYKDLVVETTAAFLQNALNGEQSSGLMPGQSSLSIAAGDAFELALPEGFAPLSAEGTPSVYLPKGWSLSGREDETLKLQSPSGLQRGSHSIYVVADSGAETPIGYTVHVNVIDPLEQSYETYYDQTEGKIITKLNVVNKSSSLFQGKLRVHYVNESGKKRVFEVKAVQLLPKESAAFTIGEALFGERTLEATSAADGLVQKSVSSAHVYPIQAIGGTVRIDGKLDEWLDLPRFQANTVRIDNWNGADDLEAYGYWGWDAASLYLAVVVTDDIHAQTETGFNIWRGDSVQFAVGIANVDGSLPVAYSEMGLALDNRNRLHKWLWAAPPGIATGESIEMKAAIVRHEGKLIYEAAIPWGMLGTGPERIEPGLKLKLSLLVNDNDGDGRKGWVEFNSGIGAAKDIMAFGDAFLMP